MRLKCEEIMGGICSICFVACLVVTIIMMVEISNISVSPISQIKRKEIAQMVCYDLTQTYSLCKDYAKAYPNSTFEDAWSNEVVKWVDFNLYKNINLYNSTYAICRKTCSSIFKFVRLGIRSKTEDQFQKECIYIMNNKEIK